MQSVDKNLIDRNLIAFSWFIPLAGVVEQQTTIVLTNNSSGFLRHLNYPRRTPPNVDLTQHLLVPLGEVISLELHGVVLSASDDCGGYANEYTVGDNGDGVATGPVGVRSESENVLSSILEIYDNYADVNGTKWILCPKRDQGEITRQGIANVGPFRASAAGQNPKDSDRDELNSAPVFITSYLNSLHIRQRNILKGSASINNELFRLNATFKVYEDKGYKPKLATKDVWVESCAPNPCQYRGKCVDTGREKKCECRGHFSGRFCGLTICDFDPCLFGECELTETSFKCNCLPGYLGSTCEQKKRICDDNPCQGRGVCFEKNNGFYCRCASIQTRPLVSDSFDFNFVAGATRGGRDNDVNGR